jgi:hypothetical protein
MVPARSQPAVFLARGHAGGWLRLGTTGSVATRDRADSDGKAVT